MPSPYRKEYENAEEKAKDCSPHELLENYLFERDRRSYDDAQAFLEEVHARGLEIVLDFGSATIRPR